MKNKIKFIHLAICCLSTIVQAQNSPFNENPQQKRWVDSVYTTLNVNEKLGQLFVVQAYSNKGASHENVINNLVLKEKIGGIIFTKGTPEKQAILTNKFQKNSSIPLMMSMDAEWDLDMRLKGGYKFPWAMTMGAITNDELIFDMGAKIAEHCKRLGVHVNFGPVVDVNTNPKNPIIGNRSFGSNVDNVSRKGIAYTQGMAYHKVLASAKHFPGHGDTDKDSHKTLPSILHKIDRLNETELEPFRKMIDLNVGSIMIAHLNVPALEPNAKIPSSLSHRVITKLLKQKLGYKGLIFTDALDMKGVADLYPSGEVEVKAFLAGNDILLMSRNVTVAKRALRKAYDKGQITESRLAESVKKILAAKYWVGLNKYKPIKVKNIKADLNDRASDVLHDELMENAMTLIKNENDLLPLKDLSYKKIAYLALEESTGNTFFTYLNKYAKVDKINTSQIAKLKDYDYVVIGLHKSNSNPWKSYKISANSIAMINKAKQLNKNTILTVFTSPYSLQKLNTEGVNSVVMAYQNSTFGQKAAAQLIFGAIPAKGVLPVDINTKFKAGKGISFSSIGRLTYGFPESVYMDSKNLAYIDELAEYAMKINATPGMQVLVARNGKVIYDKSFGYQSNKHKKKVSSTDLYDIASITKVVATLPMVMTMDQENTLDLDQSIGTYIKRAKNTNKSSLTARGILTHQARLTPWIPFYRSTRIDSTLGLKPNLYKTYKTTGFTNKVANNIYMRNDYKDSIYNRIYDSKLRAEKKYKYSDLGYYILQDYIQNTYKEPLDDLVQNYFYQSLGAHRTTFNPLDKFNLSEIIPTEQDNYYRMQLVHGYVHDQGSAMVGGVAGHAGVFSTSNDLAKVFQMYMNKGNYGGKQYLKPEILNEYIKTQFKSNKNRRAIGFDKKDVIYNKYGASSLKASDNSFGHTGFTGTMAWADPDEKIMFIFLSNRVNPSAENRLLIKKNIRTKMHDAVYNSMTGTYKNNTYGQRTSNQINR